MPAVGHNLRGIMRRIGQAATIVPGNTAQRGDLSFGSSLGASYDLQCATEDFERISKNFETRYGTSHPNAEIMRDNL